MRQKKQMPEDDGHDKFLCGLPAERTFSRKFGRVRINLNEQASSRATDRRWSIIELTNLQELTFDCAVEWKEDKKLCYDQQDV